MGRPKGSKNKREYDPQKFAAEAAALKEVEQEAELKSGDPIGESLAFFDSNRVSDEKQESYFVGLLPDAPFDNLTVGGICFQKTTEKIRVDEQNITHRSEQIGNVLQLPASKVKSVTEAAFIKVIRPIGKRAQIYSRAMRYRRQEKDYPAARIMFLQKGGRTDNYPPSLESVVRNERKP